MELRGLAAQRGDADRVLEQPARIAVVSVRAAAGRARIDERIPSSVRMAAVIRGELGCASSPTRNSRKPSSSSASRRSAGVRSAGSLSGAASTARTWTWSLPPKRSTRPRTCTASPSAKRPSSNSTRPRSALDPSTRIDQLQREIRRAVLRPASLLTADGVDAFDRSVLGELGDRGHASSLAAPEVRSGRGRYRPVSRDPLLPTQARMSPLRRTT